MQRRQQLIERPERKAMPHQKQALSKAKRAAYKYFWMKKIQEARQPTGNLKLLAGKKLMEPSAHPQ